MFPLEVTRGLRHGPEGDEAAQDVTLRLGEGRSQRVWDVSGRAMSMMSLGQPTTAMTSCLPVAMTRLGPFQPLTADGEFLH